VRQALRESGLLIYSLNIGNLYDGPPAGALAEARFSSADAEQKMETIAADSGGFSFTVLDKWSLNAAFEYFSTALRSQYIIGFRPAAPAKPDNWRRLKIELKPPADAPREMKSVRFKYPAGFLDPSAQK
jgi:hypothetical protein